MEKVFGSTLRGWEYLFKHIPMVEESIIALYKLYLDFILLREALFTTLELLNSGWNQSLEVLSGN